MKARIGRTLAMGPVKPEITGPSATLEQPSGVSRGSLALPPYEGAACCSRKQGEVFSSSPLVFLSVVPERPTSGYAQVRSGSLKSGRLVRRHANAGTRIPLCLVGWLASATLLYAQSKTATTTLYVTVGEAEQLQLQGVTTILRIRLASGVMAKLWSDEFCGIPSQQATVITRSGTYTIPLDNITPRKKAYVCLLSSDGILRDSVLWPAAGPTPSLTSHTPYRIGSGCDLKVYPWEAARVATRGGRFGPVAPLAMSTRRRTAFETAGRREGA